MNSFTVLKTFEQDKKMKAIKKQPHKQKKMNRDQTMILTIKTIVIGTCLNTPATLATTSIATTQASREVSFKMMEVDGKHK